tara:strand:+ start:440 stop:544 length:105 start_codon:yes stop_codon:yes gene_type:complete
MKDMIRMYILEIIFFFSYIYSIEVIEFFLFVTAL